MSTSPFYKGYHSYFDNDITPTVPQWWARESLRILDKKTRILPLVNRDYDNSFQQAGDVVNLNKPANFQSKRKFQGEKIVIQDAKLGSNEVRLNQQLHVAWYMDDQDYRRSFADLRSMFLDRAVTAIANGIDQVIMGELYHFVERGAGGLNKAITDSDVLELKEKFQRADIPDEEPRYLIVGAGSERDLLDVPRFVEVDKIGDGSPIRTGMLGRIRGFDVMQASQAPEVLVGGDAVTGAVNGAHAKGQSVIAVDGFTGLLTVGAWVTIAGDMKPHQIIAEDDTAGDTTEITIRPALETSVLNDAVVTYYDPILIDQANATANQASGYDFQFAGELAYDSNALHPEIGQGVTIGADGYPYMLTDVNTVDSKFTLHRPLDEGVLNNAPIFPIPPGRYNFAFIRDAVTFVNRPLAPVEDGKGVRSATLNWRGIAIRINMGYDMHVEREYISISTLCGVRLLDGSMGAVLYG